LFSPLEQFSLNVIYSYRFAIIPEDLSSYSPVNTVWLTFDNMIIFSFVSSLFVCILCFAGTRRTKLIPTPLQYILETIYKFLCTTLTQQAGAEAIFFLPMAMTLFLFILSSNLAGLANWSYTVTAHLILTFFLAFSLNLGLFILWFIQKTI
jgi:F-type H+-transporting ATPase subunit a